MTMKVLFRGSVPPAYWFRPLPPRVCPPPRAVSTCLVTHLVPLSAVLLSGSPHAPTNGSLSLCPSGLPDTIPDWATAVYEV